MKKLIAFDQDDTLNVTKMPIEPEMADLLTKLLDKFEVCVISGTGWEVMKLNEPDQMTNATNEQLAKMHFMPTCGTQYWTFDVAKNDWVQHYAHFLSDEQVAKISDALEAAAKKLGYWCDDPVGEIIENRLSQVTFSAVGQYNTPEAKHAWGDADGRKRLEIIREIQPVIDELDVIAKVGGTTSVDVTLPGIDKAYGMEKLMEATGLKKDEILFIGDKLDEGGNDRPVLDLGIDCVAVKNWHDTANVLRGILAVS